MDSHGIYKHGMFYMCVAPHYKDNVQHMPLLQ